MRFVLSWLNAAMLVAALAGCGGDQGLQKGERLQVEEELREAAATQWEQPYSDGFNYVIPTGTLLEVLHITNPNAPYFECTIVQVNGLSDPAEIRRSVVPERILNKQGFQGFSFSLPKAYVGTKLTRLKP